MQTITTRTVSAPPIRLPLGGHFELTLNLTGLSLTGKTVRFIAAPVNENLGLARYLLDSVQDATEIAASGSTITINVPPATPSNDDAGYLLSELAATGSFAYSVTITDDAEDDQVLARVQGNVTWIRDTGKFKDSAQGASVFDLTIANGAVISLEISVVGGGATVDNESVNDAIEEDAAATRSSLGLGSAALAASSAFATAAQGTAADAAKAKTDHLTVTQPVDLDAMESKLAGVEAGATADQTDAEIRTAYENERTVMSQAEAEAGSETTVRLLNALRIKQAVDARIAQIIDGSPTALDTLNELAAALGDDPNFATTMATALAGKQPIDATLTAFAALVGAANKLPYFSGDDTFTLADFTAAARTLLAAADAAAQREAMGLVIGTDVLAPNGSGAALTALNPSALGTGTGAVTIQAGGTNQDASLQASGTGREVIGLLELTDYILKKTGDVFAPKIDFADGSWIFFNAWNGTRYCGAGYDGGVGGLLISQTGGIYFGSAGTGFFDASIVRIGTNQIGIGSGAGGFGGSLKLTNLEAVGALTLGESTVGTLPTASSNARKRWEVTDANSPSVGATVSGGGSSKCTVRSDGTNWVVIELL